MLEKVESFTEREPSTGSQLCLEQESEEIAKIVGYKYLAGNRLWVSGDTMEEFKWLKRSRDWMWLKDVLNHVE